MSRARERIEALFDLARDPGGGATRPAYSPQEARAMLLVAGWMSEAGLLPRLDRFGNLWGVPPVDGPFVTSGSHVDTVPNGGRLDGALGTVLALEAVEISEGPFGVLVCAGEEAPRFGAGTLGSRQLAGRLSEEELAEMEDADGVSVLEARAAFLDLLREIPGLEDPDPMGRVAAHAEVHVEQRRDLRDRGAAVGVATAVAGPARYRMAFEGATGHTGESPMEGRRDALCAAAGAVLVCERLSREAALAGASVVATVGTVEAEPNSLTAIPSRVQLGLDVRATDATGRDDLVSRLALEVGEMSEERGVGFAIRKRSVAEPTTMDGRVVEAVEGVARKTGVPVVRCVSRAGHDAQHVAARVPAALLFAASSNGVSHAPGEEIDDEDLEGALTLLSALLPELWKDFGGGRP